MFARFTPKNLLILQEIRRRYPKLDGLEVFTVDNFQGEENRIILLSLVRGGGDSIGFLSESNRLCVALSRAREGLFVVGNMDTLAEKSKMWQNLKDIVPLGDFLEVTCFAHPENLRSVRSLEDFEKVNDIGCEKGCGVKLSCGHVCAYPCHYEDRLGHTSAKYKCSQKCLKECSFGHPCKKLCSEPCLQCDVLIPEVKAECGHTVRNVECGLRGLLDSCGSRCDQHLQCGHECGLPCHGNSSLHLKKCLEKCLKSKRGCENGHPCPKLCWEICDKCSEPCLKDLPCGHQVKALCGDSLYEVECKKRCDKRLSCGHKCRNYCYECREGCAPCYRCN